MDHINNLKVKEVGVILHYHLSCGRPRPESRSSRGGGDRDVKHRAMTLTLLLPYEINNLYRDLTRETDIRVNQNGGGGWGRRQQQGDGGETERVGPTVAGSWQQRDLKIQRIIHPSAPPPPPL